MRSFSGATVATALVCALAAAEVAAQTGDAPREPSYVISPPSVPPISPPEPPNYDVNDLQLGCDEGDMHKCTLLAGLYTSGRQVEKDLARAKELYERACQAGEATACYLLAWQLRAQGDAAGAASLFEQACDGGAGWACLELGHMRAAAEYYAKACEAGAQPGCLLGGDMYRTGKGVARDPSRGLALLERGCELGDPSSCQAAAWMHELGETGTKNPQRAADLRARAAELMAQFAGKAYVGPGPQDGGDEAARSLADVSQGEAEAEEPSPDEPLSQSVDELLAQLRQGKAEARIDAAWELARAGSVGAEGVAALVRALAGRDERLREAAAWALGSLDDAEAKTALESFYDVPAKLTRQSRPVYPPTAFVKKVDGTVVVRGLIGSKGRVVRTAIVESVRELDKSALACVRQWEFKPATRKGRPGPTVALMPVGFRIY